MQFEDSREDSGVVEVKRTLLVMDSIIAVLEQRIERCNHFGDISVVGLGDAVKMLKLYRRAIKQDKLRMVVECKKGGATPLVTCQ